MSATTAQRIHVLLLENIHSSAVNVLQSQGFEVEHLATSLRPEQLLEKLLGPIHYQFVGIRSKTQILSDVLQALADRKRLPLAIGCFCIGTDQVDVTETERLGVTVYNAPLANTRSVAELVLSHIISLHRRAGDANLELHRDGTWNKTSTQCHEVRGRTLGIVGYGNVGTQLSTLAEALGMQVRFFDVVQKLPYGNARPTKTLEELLSQSDVVSLHVPLLPSTHRLMDRTRLQQMKRGSFLVNTSRGNVVDLDGLAEAIRSGHLGGCAVDVFPEEPTSNGHAVFMDCRLRNLPNTILTPHIGGSTEEAQESIGREVATHFVNHAVSCFR